MSTSTGPLPPPPPPPPPTAAGILCPSCKAAAPPGTRFCPQCGTALPGTATSAPGGAGPVDIRQKVDADRGVLKKLQLLIPGFRGYREGEDIRDADSILRREIADKLVGAIGRVQKLRESLAQANMYAGLTDLAPILSDMTVLEGRVRHAEQGYSGISPPVRIKTNDLDRLYEYDYGFVMASDQLTNELGPLEDAGRAGDQTRVRSETDRLRGLVAELRMAFEARMLTIEGIKV